MKTIDLGFNTEPKAAMNQMIQIAPKSYSIKDRGNGQISLINRSSDLDRVQVTKYQSREIPDIYKGSGINPAAMSPSRTGRNVAVVFSSIAKVDDEETHLEYHLPLKATLSLTLPTDALIDQYVVGALLSAVLTSWTYPAEWASPDEDPTWARALDLAKGALEPDLTQDVV